MLPNGLESTPPRETGHHRLPPLRKVNLRFGGAEGLLMAGPFQRRSGLVHGTFIVKMAAEQRGWADVTVAVEDFGVPDTRQFKHALYAAAKELLAGGLVFVGCGYGVGRTGTFLAALFKLHDDMLVRLGQQQHRRDPIRAVRQHYLSYAVETPAQEKFVHSLDVRWLSRWLVLQRKPLSVFDKRFWWG